MDIPQTLYGMRVQIVKPCKVSIKRTWRERLFSLPWTPLVANRIEYHEMMKDGDFIINKETQTIYCNAKTFKKVDDAIKSKQQPIA